MEKNEGTDLLQQLHRDYTASLGPQFDQIENLIDAIACSDTAFDEAQQFLRELHRQVHSLSGSSGSFGYDRLHKEARNLDQRLNVFLKKSEPLHPDALQQLRSEITAMRRLTDAAIDQQARKQPAISKESSEILASTTELSEKLVYVIEDDLHVGAEIMQQLSLLGTRVNLLENATLAAQAIKQQMPDALLIDIGLPEGMFAGTQLVSEMQQRYDNAAPVLFFSARGDWDSRLAAVRAGGRAFLTKPLDYGHLLALLNQSLLGADNEPYRVLIVDDSVAVANYTAEVLRMAGMSVEILNHPEKIFDVLLAYKPELILLDLYMPEVNGNEVARVLRQHPDLMDIPIVFLSTEKNADLQYATLAQGEDFLQKPIQDEHLLQVVQARIQRSRQLGTLMFNDGLTGLLNHVALKQKLEEEISRNQRAPHPVSFVMLDIDHFKMVNDRFGHPAGDRVLKTISRVLQQRLRKADQIGRYGGEEFAVILPATTAQQSVKIINDIRERFELLSHSADSTTFHCTFSAGVAELLPGEEADTLVQRADKALYDAKNHGRNQVHVAS